MSINDNKFQRDRCTEFLPSVMYLVSYMERFNEEFPNLKLGYDGKDLRSLKQIMETNFKVLKKRFQETIYSNDGPFVTFDVGVPTGINFLKKIEHEHGPEGIIKVGDTVEFDPGEGELNMIRTFASVVRRPRGKVVGFITGASYTDQDIVVAKSDGKCFVMRWSNPEFTKKYKITRP